MSVLEQELRTLPEHFSSHPVNFRRVRVAQYLVFCVVFCRSLFVLLSFDYCIVCSSSNYSFCMLTPFVSNTFHHCIVCSSIYSFWLRPLYLQTFDQCLVCPSSNYGFWLHPWYLQTFEHCVACPAICGFVLRLWYLRTFLIYIKIYVRNNWYVHTCTKSTIK